MSKLVVNDLKPAEYLDEVFSNKAQILEIQRYKLRLNYEM